MMVARRLPRDAYGRLRGTLLASVVPTLPADTRVLSVETEDGLVACTALIPIWHLEGTWIAPPHRRSVAVGRALLQGIRRECARLGDPEVWAMATTDANARLCEKLGHAVPLDCQHYAIQMKRVSIS